jgi:hypothetical protein
MSNEDQLRTIAGQVLNGPALDSFVSFALMSAFTNDAGEVDEEKVMGNLTAIFAAGQPQEQPRRQWGQYSMTGGPPNQTGDNARSALAKRHGVKNDTDQPGAPSRVTPGDAARAALQRRHGVKGQK